MHEANKPVAKIAATIINFNVFIIVSFCEVKYGSNLLSKILNVIIMLIVSLQVIMQIKSLKNLKMLLGR